MYIAPDADSCKSNVKLTLLDCMIWNDHCISYRTHY